MMTAMPPWLRTQSQGLPHDRRSARGLDGNIHSAGTDRADLFDGIARVRIDQMRRAHLPCQLPPLRHEDRRR